MRMKKKMMLSDYFLLFTEKLKYKYYRSNKNILNIHHHGFQYIHIYKDYFISNYNNNAGIVGKIEIFNDKNRDCRVIGLLI